MQKNKLHSQNILHISLPSSNQISDAKLLQNCKPTNKRIYKKNKWRKSYFKNNNSFFLSLSNYLLGTQNLCYRLFRDMLENSENFSTNPVWL